MYATGQQNSTLKIVFRLNGNKVTNRINIDKMEAFATGIFELILLTLWYAILPKLCLAEISIYLT